MSEDDGKTFAPRQADRSGVFEDRRLTGGIGGLIAGPKYLLVTFWSMKPRSSPL